MFEILTHHFSFMVFKNFQCRKQWQGHSCSSRSPPEEGPRSSLQVSLNEVAEQQVPSEEADFRTCAILESS